MFRQRARIVLPFLVRLAKASQPITYSQLADLIGIPNPRNLNHILGAVGNGLIELGARTGIKIPPIQCLVLNKQTGFPSEGIGYVIDTGKFKKLSKSQKKQILQGVFTEVFAFEKWDWVLREFQLKSVKTNLSFEIEKARQMRGGGESPHHKAFKEFISKNPVAVKLPKSLGKGQTEYSLLSADCIDILFKDRTTMIGVEVKSKISDRADILRGLFQCVKYKSLLEAEQIIQEKKRDSRIILALEGELPADLVVLKNLLDIEVVDSIKNRS